MITMKNLTLCIMTVVVLVLQLVSPAPVRADGETPPPSTDVASPTHDPVETSTPSPDQQDTSEPSLETPVETSAPIPSPVDTLEPTIDTAQATLSSDVLESSAEVDPTESVTPEVATPTSVLEAAQTIADDTSVVVLDENGQSLPLASQEAAQVIANSDPVWCPAGQAPTPGSNGCTTSYATLADLVANEGGNIAADGTIWITSGLVPEVSIVTIDGLTYTAWSNYGLTLQGGWNGISGDPNIGENSVFSVPIEIINWNNSIVINNVNIENVVTSAVDYLEVQTNSGDITISNSSISNNTNISEYIAGVRLSTPGNVTINDSNFNNNVGPNLIGSANLTINNSSFTNLRIAEAAVNYLPFGDCSEDTMNNVIVSNSNFSNITGGAGLSVLPLCELADTQYDANIKIDNSTFNNNITGAFLNGGNITINNSSFNNNTFTGLIFIGNGTINNSVIIGNEVGTTTLGTVTLNDVTIAHNDVGLGIGCDWPDIQVLLNLNNVSFIGNVKDVGSGRIEGTGGLDCENTTARITYNNSLIISSQSEGEFALDCDSVDGYSVNLNGDLVQIFCPVSGRVHISSLDDTALPAPLPADYSYASAFSLDILQDETPIPVITEGGYLKASFDASSRQAEDTYSILYWDKGTWIPLDEFMLGENGKDPREILSGVKLVTNNGSPRVDVSTNFPGIFVFAQH